MGGGMSVCSKCGRSAPAPERFCRSCGTPLVPPPPPAPPAGSPFKNRMTLPLVVATAGAGIAYAVLGPILGSGGSCCMLTAFGLGALLLMGMTFDWLKTLPRP